MTTTSSNTTPVTAWADDFTPAEIAAVIAEAEASGAVVWPEPAPMPELRDLPLLPWERARMMGFPFNVPNGADEEADGYQSRAIGLRPLTLTPEQADEIRRRLDGGMMVGSHPADPRERTVAVFDEDAGDYLPDEDE